MDSKVVIADEARREQQAQCVQRVAEKEQEAVVLNSANKALQIEVRQSDR